MIDREAEDLKLEVQPAHQRIADALRRRIAFGVYTPGQRLPSERELAKAFGAGRTTVRAAVRVLTGEGLLETKRGRAGGTVVVDRQPGHRVVRSRQHRQAIARAAEEVRQTYEFRLMVEPPVARLCAEQATRTEREEIVAIAESESGGVAKYRALDSRFHLAIASACGNQHALDSLKAVRAEFFQWADAFFDVEWTPQLVWAQSSMREHVEIATAIMRGDGCKAERLMDEHLSAAADIYERIVTSGGLPTAPGG